MSQDISLLAVDDLSSSARLLVVVAHPDDEVLGAGGLIARTKATGAAVLVVVVTSGDGFPEGVELEDRMSHPTPQRDFTTNVTPVIAVPRRFKKATDGRFKRGHVPVI